MRGSKALRFKIRLFSADTVASAVALLLSASYGSQRPSRCASFTLKMTLSRSGDGIGFGGSNQQPGLPMMTLLPRRASETSRPLREGRERRVVFGQRPGKQQWVATQQPAGNARLAAAATGCDEAAERRRPASLTFRVHGKKKRRRRIALRRRFAKKRN